MNNDDRDDRGIEFGDWKEEGDGRGTTPGDGRGTAQKNRGDVGREQYRGEPIRGDMSGQDEGPNESITAGGYEASLDAGNDENGQGADEGA
ncbi:MAG TPA: hypothetical protein VNT60_07450 [Deinococcales bacterium]|nr:hypothetical protein [Deinococcales bacterium]